MESPSKTAKSSLTKATPSKKELLEVVRKYRQSKFDSVLRTPNTQKDPLPDPDNPKQPTIGANGKSFDEYKQMITLNYNDDQLIANIHDSDTRTVHKPLIDIDDEDEMLPGVDSSNAVGDNAIKTGNYENMREGYGLNRDYVMQAADINAYYPHANIIAKDSVPISMIYKKAKQIRRPQTMTARSRVIGSYRAAARQRAVKVYSRAKLLRRFATDDQISVSQQSNKVKLEMVNEISENMGIAALVKASAISNKKFKEEIMLYYYLPKNCTLKAMKALVADSIAYAGDPKMTSTRYHLPSRTAMSQVCLEGSFTTLEDLEVAVETGTMLKTMKELAIRSKSDASFERSQAPLEINDYYIEKETTLVKGLIEEESGFDYTMVDEEFVGDYQRPVNEEDEFFERETEKALDELKDVYENGGEMLYIRPFVHSAAYTYKIIFQVYLNRHGFKLPFGRTIPSLPWLYIFSYYLDPENVLQLRMSKDQYMFKIGGIGLLEKSIVKQMPVDSHIYNLFKPSTSTSGDLSVFKNAVVSAYTILIKMKACIDTLSELKDIKEHLQSDVASTVDQMLTTSRSVGITQDHDISGILNDSTTIANKIFDPSASEQDLERLIFDLHGFQYVAGQPRLSDAIAPLSYDSAFMASVMAKFASDWENGSEVAQAWYVKGVLNKGKQQNKSFDLVSEMLVRADFQSMAIKLFGSKEAMENARSFVKKAREIVANNSTELMNIVCSREFTVEAELSWTNTFASQTLNQNKVISSIVKRNLEDSFAEDRQTPNDSRIEANPDPASNLMIKQRFNPDDEVLDVTNPPFTLSELLSITSSTFYSHIKAVKVADLETYGNNLKIYLAGFTVKGRKAQYIQTMMRLTIEHIGNCSNSFKRDDLYQLYLNMDENIREIVGNNDMMRDTLKKLTALLKSDKPDKAAESKRIKVARKMLFILSSVFIL